VTSRPAVSHSPASADLARLAAQAALSKKATDVVILHVGDVTPVADCFVLASGSSEPQVKAILEAVEDTLAEHGHRPWHIEGRDALRWVLLDYVDVVVHVFRDTVREYYLLERLWGDARREVVEDAGPAAPRTAVRGAPEDGRSARGETGTASAE
jgi:ribosome-associated protein